MLEGQFYTRLILNIIIGIMFAYALVKMAKHNNQEIEPKKHIVMKIFGWIFIGLSGLLLITCIVSLVNVDFPPSVIGPIISPNMIVRPTSATFYWGYPTIIQNSILSSAMGVFSCLGFGGYFLYFKSSKSKWWKKILKFFTVLFLYAFMASSTNFHYFDFWEFVAPILFLTLWFIIINRDSNVKNQTHSIKDSFDGNDEEQNNNYPNDDISDNNVHINESDIIEVPQKNIPQFEDHSIGLLPKVPTSKSINHNSINISIKPYFWIGLILIILGNVWCLCFEHFGIYLTDTNDYYGYEYINPWNYRVGIYPTNKKDPALNFSPTLRYDIKRLQPFKQLNISRKYALFRKGQELWIYELPYELRTSYEKLNYLRERFKNVDFPLNLVERWNGSALGEDAVSYYIENEGKISYATVFIYKNHLGVALSTGENIEECERLNEITLSKFSKFDYNSPHISVSEFKTINIIAWILILSILSIFLIKKVKSIGCFTSCINKQSKVIAILNICYLMGWLIFSIILVLSIDGFIIEQVIWAGFILVWLIICTILNYTIKMSVEPKSEFYLIPKWLKKTLVKRNLNTKLVYRIILLFILWPFFYLCLVPVVGFIPCIYTACASGILGLVLCCISAFNWIKQGKGVKVE